MLIEFENGKIIATPHEIVVRIKDSHHTTMQAHVDSIQLIGNGANVISANNGECKWSVKLDNEEQLITLANTIGIAPQ